MLLDGTCQEMVRLCREIHINTQVCERHVRVTFQQIPLARRALWDSRRQPYLPDQPIVDPSKVFDSRYTD